MRLLFEHNSKLGNVLVRAEEGECEGERNTAGEMEGLGTKRNADGSVYEGEWLEQANHRRLRGGARSRCGHECMHSSAALALVM